MDTVFLTVRVDPALKADLQKRAATEKRTLSEIVVRCLSQAASRWEKKP